MSENNQGMICINGKWVKGSIVINEDMARRPSHTVRTCAWCGGRGWLMVEDVVRSGGELVSMALKQPCPRCDGRGGYVVPVAQHDGPHHIQVNLSNNVQRNDALNAHIVGKTKKKSTT